MSPSIVRSSLSSLRYCKSCTHPLNVSRPFTTTPTIKAIGPESPLFIDIPTTLQPNAVVKRDIKGTLPPPRNIFHPRAGDKLDPSWLASAAKEPSSKKALASPANDYVAWKRRMAVSRRNNLREGLAGLHKRKVAQETQVASRSASLRRDRQIRVAAPQREDERLTNPTITAAMRALQVGHVPDPTRAERLVAKAERVAAKEVAQSSAREDALHELYMQARSFITNEAQLGAEIDRVFVEFPYGKAHPDKENVWEAYGAPPAVRDLLSDANNTQKTAMAFHAGPSAVLGKRMKKIAEELTGGKMD